MIDNLEDLRLYRYNPLILKAEWLFSLTSNATKDGTRSWVVSLGALPEANSKRLFYVSLRHAITK